MVLNFAVIISFLIVGYFVKKYVGLVNITNPIVPLFYYHSFFFLLAITYRDIYVHFEHRNEILWLIIFGYLIFFFVFLFFYRALKLPNGFQSSISFSEPKAFKSPLNVSSYILQTLVIIALILFFIKCRGVPILHEDANNFRIEARKGVGYLIVLCRAISYVFVATNAFHIFSSKIIKQNKNVKIFSIYFLATIILFIGIGSRAPVFDLILILVALKYWIQRKKIDSKIIFLGFGLLVLLGVGAVFRQGIALNSLSIFQKSIWRPFTNIQNLHWVFDEFPQNGEFLYGKSFFIELKTLLPGYQPNFGTWFKESFDYEFSGGSVTVTYLGELYSNFGYCGAILGSCFYALFVLLVTYFLVKMNSLKGVLCLTMLSLSMKGIINVGLVATIISTIMPMVVSLFLLFGLSFFLFSVASQKTLSSN